MIAAAPPTFRPRSDLLHVRLLTPAERTTGGVWLPETAQRRGEEAEVLAVGPGRLVPGVTTMRSVTYAEPGDHVLIRKHLFHPLTPDSREGIAVDTELLALIDPATGEIATPLNDWVLCDLADWEERQGSVLIAEIDQHRPPCGRVRKWGPGRLDLEPVYRRVPVPDILGIPEPVLRGLKVRWGRSEDVLEVGREQVGGTLVRACDLIAWEE